MKRIITFVLLLFTIITFTFSASEIKNFQQGFWPALKGKWYYTQGTDTSIIYFIRSHSSRQIINFISKDSCEIRSMAFNDSYVNTKYKWVINKDTFSTYRKNDTLRMKIIDYSNSQLIFKPIFKGK